MGKYYNANSLTNYLNVKDNLLSKEETLELINKYRSGDLEARHTLVLRNIGLVFYAASIFKLSRDNIYYEDYIQEGILGLYDAVDKYDSSRGGFSSCALSYILHKMFFKSDEVNYIVHVSHQLSVLGRKIRRYIMAYEKENFEFPSKEQIIEKFDLSIDRYNRVIYALVNNSLITNEEALKLKLDSNNPDPKYNYIANSLESNTLDDELIRKDFCESFSLLMEKSLTKRGLEIMKLHMAGNRSIDIAKKLGISDKAVYKSIYDSYDRMKRSLIIDEFKEEEEMQEANYKNMVDEENASKTKNNYIVDYFPQTDTYYLKCSDCSYMWQQSRNLVLNNLTVCPRCWHKKPKKIRKKENY